MDGACGGEEACVVVLRGGERWISIKEGQRLVCWGVEAELALAHLQLDGGERERRVVAIFHGNLCGGRALQIGAQRRGNAQLLLVDLAAGLGQPYPKDRSGDGLRGGGRGAFGPVGDMDVAAEVGFEVRVEREGDALNGDSFRKGKGGDGLASAWGDGSSLGRSCVNGLGFAAGRDGGTFDHLRRCGEGAVAGCGRGGQLDVEVGKAGLLQVQGGVARETLRGEVEEGELTEAG